MRTLPLLLATLSMPLLVPYAGQAAEPDHRCRLWVDPYRGEPVEYDQVVDDLAKVRVVYLGEAHTLVRHHDLQLAIVRDLAARGVPLVLGLEQLERFQQPHVDRFNRGQIDFDQLAGLVDWQNRWSGYQQYRPLLDAARQLEIPVLALNARAETVRQVFRSGGVEKLDAKTRGELPEDLLLTDPPYERMLDLELSVHMAAQADRLRPMRQAQICRDETMAEALADFLLSEDGKGRTAVVVCGTGHVAYGYGIPSRVQRRIPGLADRIVVPSQSGDVELSEAELAATRPVEITHEQLRQAGRPIADYLHVTSLP